MTKKLLLSACTIAVLSLPLLANETTQSSQNVKITQKDVQEINKLSDANAIQELSASDTIDDWADKALEHFGLSEFGEHNGKFFVYAQQSVSLKPTDPQFGDALINAYDKAMMKLQEKYVMIRFGKTTVDKIKSFYSNRSTDAKKLELPSPKNPGFLDKVMLVLDKQLDLLGAKIDEELVEMGADKESLKQMTPTMKKDLFRDKFVKNTMREAQGSIAGLVTIQTSIANDAKGTHTLGVIAVVSPKTVQIAKDISLQRKSIITGRGRDVHTLLPKSPEQYLGTFGTRLAYDLDGSPMILSYGMASYVPDSGDDYINDELKADARNAAIANADAQLAELINGQMSVKEQRKTGEETRKYVEREMKPNSDTVEKMIKNIIKITDRVTKSQASAKLQGISTVKKWRFTTPDHHKYVGVVRVWKYSTLAAVNGFDTVENQNTPQQEEQENNYRSNMQASEPVNDMNDF